LGTPGELSQEKGTYAHCAACRSRAAAPRRARRYSCTPAGLDVLLVRVGTAFLAGGQGAVRLRKRRGQLTRGRDAPSRRTRSGPSCPISADHASARGNPLLWQCRPEHSHAMCIFLVIQPSTSAIPRSKTALVVRRGSTDLYCIVRGVKCPILNLEGFSVPN
jgi:hypothetical protein